jgi:preprotein translocase subunit YajC
MYFIMIRPQRKQQKQRQAMLSQMQKGDRVVTIGGFYGVIHQMKDDEIILKMDERNDVRMTVAKSAIARVVSEEDAPAKDKADA